MILEKGVVMKLILFLSFLSFSLHANDQGPTIDRVKKMVWDGQDYTISLMNFPKKIVISGVNQVVPCLENSIKAEMEVLITVDSDIPMIKSCKLYSTSAHPWKPSKQEKEKLPKKIL
jgi:hypothetical protein